MEWIVRGLKFSKGENFAEMVLYKQCFNGEEREQAIDEAFDNGAEKVIITRMSR